MAKRSKKETEPVVLAWQLPEIRPVLLSEARGVAPDIVELVENCRAVFRYLGKFYVIEIKAGYRFDGASVPMIFWGLVGHPLTPQFIPGALFHDGLYGSELLPRQVADLFFHALLDVAKVRNWKSDGMFGAVDLAGGLTWDEHTTQSVELERKFVTVEVLESLPLAAA